MTQIESDALVVRTVEVGESDVVATLMTERAGKIAALARGARKGSRRMGGALEPVHTVSVLLDDRGQELTTLKEARIVRLRSAVASNLEALEAAGIALRWARHVFPLRTPEPGGWLALVELLDGLDAGSRSPIATWRAPGSPCSRPSVTASISRGASRAVASVPTGAGQGWIRRAEASCAAAAEEARP